MTTANEPAGVWFRVSTADQSEANQVPDVERHCQLKGYNVVKRYELNDFSAYKGEQEAAQQQAIADVREGRIKVLVCWHSDRLERRGGLALLKFIAAIRDAGGRVESQQQPELGQANFSGRVVTFLSGEMDHEKSAHIAEQVKLAINRTKANGGVSNNLPWGFMPEGEKYKKLPVPTEVCWTYAPQIFARCIAGDSLRTIAAWLDAEGVPTRRGSKWHENSVRRIIRNRVYAKRYGDNYLVEPHIYDRANAALKSRPKTGQVSHNPALLAKLKCANCGSPMYRNMAGRDLSYGYYRCFGSGARRKGCGNMVPLTALDDVVTKNFAAWDKPHKTRQWIEGKHWENEISEIEQDLTELMSEMKANPRDTSIIARIAEKQAELAHFTELNESRELGRWEFTDVRNPDGSVMTRGQLFSSLTEAERREYLKSFDIRAFKTERGGIVAFIDTEETTEATAVVVDSAETMAELEAARRSGKA